MHHPSLSQLFIPGLKPIRSSHLFPLYTSASFKTAYYVTGLGLDSLSDSTIKSYINYVLLTYYSMHRISVGQHSLNACLGSDSASHFPPCIDIAVWMLGKHSDIRHTVILHTSQYSGTINVGYTIWFSWA